MYIITDVDYQIKLIDNMAIFNNIEKNMLTTFEQIKKNEI